MEARDPLALDERALAGKTTAREFALLLLGFSALTLALTWPQIVRLDSVADLGDPLFSIWRIAWVSHQLPRHPLALFDANQFYPEPLTLTYSDSLVVPALILAFASVSVLLDTAKASILNPGAKITAGPDSCTRS